MKTFQLLCFVAFFLNLTEATSNLEIAKVVSRLGWKRVIIASSETYSVSDLAKKLAEKSIHTTVADLNDLEKVYKYSDRIVLHGSHEEAVTVLKWVAKQDSYTGNVAFVDISKRTLADLEDNLKDLKVSTSLFVIKSLYGREKLFRIQTYKLHNTVTNSEWIFNPKTGFYLENYSLHGIQLSALGLDWWPWLSLDDCNESSAQCSVNGINADVVKVLGYIFNFTVSYNKDPDGIWGGQPVNDVHASHVDAEFNGVFGSVVHEETDFSISGWKNSWPRDLWVDFSSSFADNKNILITNALKPPMDFTSLMRTFQVESWIYIILTVTAIVLIIAVQSYLVEAEGEPDSMRIIQLTGWLFFVLINAFLGGALTMFYSSQPKIPFSTLPEAIEEFPNWSLHVLNGYQINIQEVADVATVSQKEAFQYYLDLLKSSDGAEYIFNDIAEGIKDLEEAGNYLLAPEASFNDLQVPLTVELQVIGTADIGQNSLIFPKNSPLTPIFNLGLMKLRRNGVLDVLRQKWQRKLPNPATVAKNVIGWEQSAMVFYVYWMLMLAVGILVVLEMLAAWIGRSKGLIFGRLTKEEDSGKLFRKADMAKRFLEKQHRLKKAAILSKWD